jgi:hypothetical protein
MTEMHVRRGLAAKPREKCGRASIERLAAPSSWRDRDSAFLRKKTWLKSGGGQLDIREQLRKDRGKNAAIDFER